MKSSPILLPIYHLYYYEHENMFADPDGHVVYDLFSLITPQDLFLFRTDHGNNYFPLVNNPAYMCEITILPGEDCGAVEPLYLNYKNCNPIINLYDDLFLLNELAEKKEQ